MHQRIEKAIQKIAYEATQLHNTAAYIPRLLKAQEVLTDEWAGKLYAAHCEAWIEQTAVLYSSSSR